MVLEKTKTSQFTESFPQSQRFQGLTRWLVLLAQDKAALVSLVLLLVITTAAFITAYLTADAPVRPAFSDRLLAPSLTNGHLLGTDTLGRDLLLRILQGTQTSLLLSVTVVSLSVVLGAFLGLTAGYGAGWLDDLIMRVTDVALGFPSLLIALIVLYVLGPSITNMVIVLSFTRWMLYTRVVRAETLRLKHYSYVEAAQLIGGGSFWITRRHILPNIISLIFTLSVLELSSVILSESSLSFLGLGIQPPASSLGLLVAQGTQYMTKAWWLVLFPGLTISLITISLIMLSNWLGIALDPVQRWRLLTKQQKAKK